jgi:hypothetical protein
LGNGLCKAHIIPKDALCISEPLVDSCLECPRSHMCILSARKRVFIALTLPKEHYEFLSIMLGQYWAESGEFMFPSETDHVLKQLVQFKENRLKTLSL